MQTAGAIRKDEDDFFRESRGKKVCYVHMNQAVVKDESHLIHIDLGSCASVVLCGLDGAGKAWFGANHLFKSRIANSDMALEHIAALYNSMIEQDVKKVCCLGLFGAGYRENSLAKSTAQMNVLTILEALSLYNLSIEIFQTGYSQGISILKSDARQSFLIMHKNLGEKSMRIIEIPLIQIFR